MKLEDLGYNSFFETAKKQLELGDLPVARVIFVSRGFYRLKNNLGEYEGSLSGNKLNKISENEQYPVVGDWVSVKVINEKQVQIIDVLPRKTAIKRKYGRKNAVGEKTNTQILGANIDVAFIVESVDRDYNLNRFERYVVVARAGGVVPVAILNKTDLISQDEKSARINEFKKRFPDVKIFAVSTFDKKSLINLKDYIQKGITYCFLGSSGVGKSTLVNEIIGKNIVRTGDIGERSGRGKHVTTSRQIYFLNNGGILIDNPGLREIGIIDEEGVGMTFKEISILSKECKYSDCTHIHEPQCAVIKALEANKLDREQYLNFLNLRKDAEYLSRNKVETKAKQRNFGKLKKNFMKDFKKYER